MSAPGRVLIHYRRLPDDERVFDQRIVLEASDVVVTVSDPLPLAEPLVAGPHIMLEDGSRAVWFTFPGAWHDIGLFHRADGTFTGVYGNILTPPELRPGEWRTTDLFLDIWIPAGGEPELLDEDELAAALAAGHIDEETAARARDEASRLMSLARAGRWPPAVTRDWTLARIEEEEGSTRR